MDVKVKAVAFYTRKYLLFSLESTYKFVCRHPFLASFAYSLFLLHSCYPFLFAFLISSSPVLFCTALLLGTLLCYGEPNIPEIEEDEELNGKFSFLNVENSLDDLFVKKDKSFTIEDLSETSVGTKGRIFNVSATDVQNERDSNFLAVSSSADGQNKTGEDYILEQGVEENVGVLLKKQPEIYMRMSGVTNGVAEGVDGLTVKSDLDEWIDSSIGSPWQPISIFDAASDSESDLAESSSPDASMTDILPLLEKLHPILDSKESKSLCNSDAELSQHRDSDEGSVEHEDGHKIEGSDASNQAITWAADDQKKIMDLGSSDLERNRRLESMIARRRARKNQIIIFEKDLIDLHSKDTSVGKLFFSHPHIPPISAPRRNPFDPHHDLDDSEEYPPIPGSAPSVFLRRQSPFDFPCCSEDGAKGSAGDNICLPETGLTFPRGLTFRRCESYASRSLFPSNVMHQKHVSSSSRLKPYFVSETMGLEHNECDDSVTMSSPIEPEHQKELAEQEMHDRDLEASIIDTKANVQIGQSYRDDLVDFDPCLKEDGHFVDPNSYAVNEETRHNIDAPGIFENEIEEAVFPSLMLDGQKHELVEDNHDKNSEIIFHKALETQGQISSFLEGTSKFLHSSDAYASHLFCETVDKSQIEAPNYDYSPYGIGNFIANICGPNETEFSSGREGPNSTSYVESHAQEELMEVVSHARAFEESITSELMNFDMVHGSKFKDSTSTSEEPVTFATYINLLDEDIMTTIGVSETGEQNFNENVSAGLYEDFVDLVTSTESDQYGFSSKQNNLNETDFAFPVGFLPQSDAEEKYQSLEKLELQTSFGELLEESQNSNSKLRPILEESSDEFGVKEEQVSLIKASIMSFTGSHMLEEPNVCKSSVGMKLAVDEKGNEKGTAFLPVSSFLDTDDILSRSLNGELLDRMEFLNLYEMMPGYESGSNEVISDSQACDVNEFQTNPNTILMNLNDFYAKAGDLDAEIIEMQSFNEHLLSELDAVGNFQVEGLEPQLGLYMTSQSAGQLYCSVEDSELSSADYIDASPKKPINMHLVSNQRKTKDSGSWSLSVTPVEDLELTVYKPQVNVLQAYSLEGLYSSSEHDPSAEFLKSSLSETIEVNFVVEKPRVELNKFDMSNQFIEAIPHHATLLPPFQKSDEGICSYLISDAVDFGNLPPAPDYFQLNDNHSSMIGCKFDSAIDDACVYDLTEIQSFESKVVDEETIMSFTCGLTSNASLMDETETSLTGLDISSRDLEIGETNLELLVVEAKTIEDIDAAFKQASETVFSNHLSSPAIPKPKIIHTVDNFLGAISHEAEGLILLEAKSIEDINSALKEASKDGLSTPDFCFSDPKSLRTSTDFEEIKLSSPDIENLSQLFGMESKSAKDIQLAFKQGTVGVSTMPTSPLVDTNLIRDFQDLEFVEEVSHEIVDNSEWISPERKFSVDNDSSFKQFEIEKMAIHSNAKPEDDSTEPVYAEKSDDLTFFKQKLGQVYLEFSHETQIDPILFVRDAKSEEGNNLNSTSQQNTQDYLVHPTSQDDPEFFHPHLDAVGKKSLNAEDKQKISALETKSFEDTHLDSESSAADLFSNSTTFLFNLENVSGKEIQNEKSLDYGNTSDLHFIEAKSLEDLNLTFKKAAKDCLAMPPHKDGTDYDTVKGNYDDIDYNSELIVVKDKLNVNLQSAVSDTDAGVQEGLSSLSGNSMPSETHPGAKVEDFKCTKAHMNSEILINEANFDNINS